MTRGPDTGDASPVLRARRLSRSYGSGENAVQALREVDLDVAAGEFLVLLGSFQVNVLTTAFASLGLIVAAVYSLIVIQKVFHGKNINNHAMADLGTVEMMCFSLMLVGLVWMGMYPQSMLDLAQPTLQSLGIFFP